MGVQGILTASWIHNPPPSAVSEICYHEKLVASEDQMDIFNVAVKSCVCVRGSHRGREGETVPALGVMCTHPLTPNAWCLQSASCCHRELVRSHSCPGISISEVLGGAFLLEWNTLWTGRWSRGECSYGAPVGMVLSPDSIYLG